MSIDAAHIRSLVSKEEECSAFKGRTQTLCVLAVAVSAGLLLFQMSPHLIPMRAEEYQRLDDAIHALAAARDRDPDKIWRQIYFRLHISGLHELKQSQAKDISRFILEKLAEEGSGL